MQDFDQLHRYLFSEAQVRGEMVRLQESYNAILSAQSYPSEVQVLLGELMAATSLLTATLKFEGDISLQLQSQGPLKYAVINGTDEQKLRGVARWEEGTEFGDFLSMCKDGILVITISPEKGERYQGIVKLEKPSLAECVEDYFAQSEQLATRILLGTEINPTQPFAWGMLVQALPGDESDKEAFERIAYLTETMNTHEAKVLEAQDLLYRLYHQEKVELFEPQEVEFKCSCSKERSAAALSGVDEQELLDIVAEEGSVTMNCQYCHAVYSFDAIDVKAIKSGTYGQNSSTVN
ncbi:Hsp33 family molecular chaperone HslO [Alteromonadaceae bacterium M269]|nr:Hsp33 family molecular chaperone HslO [Alteromonadaceae bacterium M269]